MTAFFRLLSDLSAYCALILYLACLILRIPYFMPGFGFLLLTVCVLALACARQEKRLIAIGALIPLLSLLFKPSLLQFAMMVPVWIYLVYSALKETYDLSWYECLKLCRTILLVQVLAALCLFFLPGWADALINAIPFVSVELCAMVCSLRYFRQEHTGGMISLGLCAGVSLFSLFAALTGFFPVLFGKFKQWYLRLVSLLFNIGSAQVLPPAEEIEIPSAVNPDLPSGELLPSDGNAMPAVIEQIKEMGLLEKIIIVLIIVIAVGTIIYLLFYSMKGHRYYRREHEGDISEKITPEKKHRLSLFVPSDPKEAIRWYYAKYLKEAGKHGVLLKAQMTSRDLLEQDHLLSYEDASAFRAVYIKARYSKAVPSQQDVQSAKEFWKSAKAASRKS